MEEIKDVYERTSLCDVEKSLYQFAALDSMVEKGTLPLAPIVDGDVCAVPHSSGCSQLINENVSTLLCVTASYESIVQYLHVVDVTSQQARALKLLSVNKLLGGTKHIILYAQLGIESSDITSVKLEVLGETDILEINAEKFCDIITFYASSDSTAVWFHNYEFVRQYRYIIPPNFILWMSRSRNVTVTEQKGRIAEGYCMPYLHTSALDPAILSFTTHGIEALISSVESGRSFLSSTHSLLRVVSCRTSTGRCYSCELFYRAYSECASLSTNGAAKHTATLSPRFRLKPIVRRKKDNR